MEGPFEIPLESERSTTDARRDEPASAGTGAGSPGERPFVPGVHADVGSAPRWALVVGAVVLVAVGFMLGRVVGGDSARGDDGSVADESGDDGAPADSAPDEPSPADDPAWVTLPPVEARTWGVEGQTRAGPMEGYDLIDSRGGGEAPDAAVDDAGDEPTIRLEAFAGPVSDAPTGLVVVGLTPANELVEIDLDRGEVRTTVLGGRYVPEDAPFAVALDDATLVGTRWGPSGPTAEVVPIGGQPHQLDAELELPSPIVRGESPNTVWRWTWSDSSLFGGHQWVPFDVAGGEDAGEPLQLRLNERLWSDPAGGLLLMSPQGAYQVVAGRTLRLTRDEVIAVGPNHLITYQCDDERACGHHLSDRSTGEQRPVDGADGASALTYFVGWIAPDGSAVAHLSDPRPGSFVHITDLDSGEVAELPLHGGGEYSSSSFESVVWTDDSRYLLYLTGRGLAVHDRAIGDDVLLSEVEGLPELVAFDVRPAGESLAELDAVAG